MNSHPVINDKNKTRVTQLLKNARQAFLNFEAKIQNSESDKVKKMNDGACIYTDIIDGKKYRVFGVRKDTQHDIDMNHFRSQIINELELKEIKNCLQVVGDSHPFRKNATQFCRKKIAKMLDEKAESVIFYGFTGNMVDNTNSADTNQIVNEWIDDKSKGIERSKRVIANVVDKHTITAIEEWGCTIPENVSNFMLVYTNTKTPEAEFGDDVPLDGLSNENSICLDGGIQSLLQILNMLNNNVSITGIVQLRNYKDPKNVDPRTKKPYLSACEFLNFLKNEIAKSATEITESKLKFIINSYLQTHELYNPEKRDAGTKQKLWDSALHILFEKELWKKFNLFNCIPSPPSACLISTDIGGDVDDALALLNALETDTELLAVISTQIEPEEKAREAKIILSECGHNNIPVHIGIGCTRKEPKEKFLESYPLFPKAFGFPNPDKDEKEWHPKQALAYKDSYGNQFNELKIEKETGHDAIIRIAKQFSPWDKLLIIALGPLHDIAAALDKDPTIAPNIKLFTMGGLYPKGYNWLISPQITAKVISQVETVCITSDFVTKNKLVIKSEELNQIVNHTKTQFGTTFLTDWKNWKKAEFPGQSDTPLYDPTTVKLALQPWQIKSFSHKKIQFPCLDEKGNLKQEFKGIAYNQQNMQDKIVYSKGEAGANVAFVEEVYHPEKLRKQMLSSITKHLTKPPIKLQAPIKPYSFFNKRAALAVGVLTAGLLTAAKIFSKVTATENPTYRRNSKL